MALTLKQVYEKLRERHPDAGASIVEAAGDAYCIVKAEALLAVARWLKGDPEMQFDLLSSVSGTDDGKNLWSVYHLYSVLRNQRAVIKVQLDRSAPSVPSLVPVWKAADWHEREAYDMYGIVYTDHPDLRRILLPEDWPGYPLRKDYEFPDEYQGIPLK
jgi:NADH-quinone oxidoreductase subunit C